MVGEGESWIGKIIKAMQARRPLEEEGKKNEYLSKGSGQRAREEIDRSLEELRQQLDEAKRRWEKNPNDRTFQEYRNILDRYQRLSNGKGKIY